MGLLRDKTICKKNPHISKRKGGKKLPHRRFSLQVNKLSKLKPEVENCIEWLNKINTKCFFSMFSEWLQKKGSKDKVRTALLADMNSYTFIYFFTHLLIISINNMNNY
jgi:hypothetical protein